MSKSDAFENDIIDLIFNAVAIADIAENDTTSPATTLTLALHTADPTDAGNMASSEAAYTSYARQTVDRDAGGFTVSGDNAVLAANLDFPAATGGSETITHFSIGSGVGNNMMYSGEVTPNIVVTSGVTPRLTTATKVTEG